MAVFKCKMCGGALEVSNETVATCEYCGTQQTLPKLDDDRRANLYDRANHFRRNNDFDKAMGIYEQILNEDKTDAEAYWSLVLCRYGIEYVEDPASHKRTPTVNRAQYTSVFDDNNYKSALEYADLEQRHIYEQEAKAINEIQKGILAISQKEEPFDVFICYKEADNNGRRTPDSVLAQDLYYQLTQEGFKVFFARITLEDKLGSAYEPYIFAALNSAKVMVALGTKPEHFTAVWVKNEWSRYLSLIKQGQKKTLIPAFKDMDPYDLPDEFSHLQAQDMSKLGFMQDLIRGIKKIIGADEPKPTVVKETVITGSNVNTAPLLKRAFMFLEDGDWSNADEYCEKVLDVDPECAEAYLGKLMAELHVKNQEALKDCAEPFDSRNSYKKAVRFGDEALKNALAGYIQHINIRNENDRLERIRKAEIARKEAEPRVRRNKIIAIVTSVIITFVIVLITVIIPAQKKSAFMETHGQIYKGARISFGTYEQDNNTSNGKEAVEWIVLEENGNKLFLISKNALDCKPFNSSGSSATWETCTLRKWLNNDFINSAFSAEERAIISTVTVPADKNPEYDSNPGNATQDKVFVLSITEANKYSTGICSPTDYALANGAFQADNGNFWWWLRSPGQNGREAALVSSVGGVIEHGYDVDFAKSTVRPAMWIDLSA